MFNAISCRWLCVTACLLMSVGATAVASDDDRIVVTLELPATFAPLQSPSGRMSYLPPSPQERQRALREQAAEIAREFGLVVEQQWPIMALGVNCIVYRIPGTASGDVSGARLMATLAGRDDVDGVQALNIFSTAAVPGRNTAFDTVKRPTGNLAPALAQLKPKASGRNVAVAVIDTGVDLAHKALRQADIAASNLVGEEPGNVPAETHGTAVLGVLLARENQALGVGGAIPEADTRLLRACWEIDGGSDHAVCNTFTLARALSVALEWPADIVNLSISGPRDPLLERLAAKFSEQGRIVIAAGTTRDGFPGSVPGSILAAEYFDVNESVMTLLPGNRFGLRKGSSVAAANMTALVALAKERRPSLDHRTVIDYLADLR